MKIKSLSLILSAVFFMTTPLFAMQEAEPFDDKVTVPRLYEWKKEGALCEVNQKLISPIVQFRSCRSFWFPNEKEKNAHLKGWSFPFKVGQDLFIFYAPHATIAKVFKKGITEYCREMAETLTFVSTLFNGLDKGFKEKLGRFYIMELSQIKSIPLDITTLEKNWAPYHHIETSNIILGLF